MRIGLVGPVYPYKGGVAQHTGELAHRLAAAGHDVVIESWRAQYPRLLYPGRQTIDEPEGTPFPRVRRELSWCRPEGWLRVGARISRDRDATVFVVVTPLQVPAYLGIWRPVHARHVPTLALCHNVLPHEQRRFDERLMRALLSRVDTVVVHSTEQGAQAARLTSRPVRVATLPPHLPAPGTGKSGLGQPHRRLLFFGIVRPYKGLDVLLRALAKGPPQVSLLVAGEFWGGAERTRRLVAELGLTDRVELRCGYVPAAQVPELFSRVDALVLPYRAATATQNVWLAHAHGVPVIATRASGLAEQVRDGVDGLLAEPDDTEDLAAALHRFYAPGEPARLRAGVRPVDPEPYWDRYLTALVTAMAAATQASGTAGTR